MRLSLLQAAKAMSAELAGRVQDVELSGASMDSRSVRPGDLFFCLPGTRVDGHDFALQAVQGGAAGVAAVRRLPDVEARAAILLVDDTVRALGKLAAAWRNLSTARVVGVTGSAGKTTVKEMLAQVCALAGDTCRNHMNWNNQIGLPLSLLSCSGRERFWVMEVGISRPGDMEELGRMLAPDMALIVNVGPAHLQALKSVQGVARAKASLLGCLRMGGMALVNRDCPDLWQAARNVLPEVRGFSVSNEKAEFFGRRWADNGAGTVRMELVLSGRCLEMQWDRTNAPLLENVLAVAGTATMLGIEAEMIRQGLAGISMPQGRFQVRRRGGWMFIDDTYNANPLSMRAALQRARELAGPTPLVCVLGDMLDLGREAAEAHRELGRRLARDGCAAVLFHGEHARDVQAGLSELSWNGLFKALDSPRALLDMWKELQTTQGVALFKGSRAGAMETYLEALCTEAAA